MALLEATLAFFYYGLDPAGTSKSP